MERLTERDSYWLGEEFWTSAKEPDDKEIDNVYAKLKEYEDLEEHGLLLRLPCKVGDILYQPTIGFVSEFRIRFIEISTCNNLFIHTDVVKGINMTGEIFGEDSIGKTVFLTKEEAERALEERK